MAFLCNFLTDCRISLYSTWIVNQYLYQYPTSIQLQMSIALLFMFIIFFPSTYWVRRRKTFNRNWIVSPADIYLFKGIYGNTRTICEIRSKLTFFVTQFEQIWLSFWCCYRWLWTSKCWLHPFLPRKRVCWNRTIIL